MLMILRVCVCVCFYELHCVYWRRVAKQGNELYCYAAGIYMCGIKFCVRVCGWVGGCVDCSSLYLPARTEQSQVCWQQHLSRPTTILQLPLYTLVLTDTHTRRHTLHTVLSHAHSLFPFCRAFKIIVVTNVRMSLRSLFHPFGQHWELTVPLLFLDCVFKWSRCFCCYVLWLIQLHGAAIAYTETWTEPCFLKILRHSEN